MIIFIISLTVTYGHDSVRCMKKGIESQIAAYLFLLVSVALLLWSDASSTEGPKGLNPAPSENKISGSEIYPVSLQISAEKDTNENIPRELLLTGETAREVISSAGGIVRLGEASIEIPAGALEDDTEITITRLLAAGETEGLKNVTAGGGGYRFLPAGQKFLTEAVIRLPYDAGLERKPAYLEDIATYYYDTAESRWASLQRVGLEEERHIVASWTTHFTDMINGTLALPEGPEPLSFNINSIKSLEAADPSAGVLGLEGLEAGYMGGASFRFALAVPEGRAGMTPGVTIGYSSDVGNGILGKGWSLEAGGEVSYDTRRGLPNYNRAEAEKGTFALDGVVLRLAGSGSSSPYLYEPLKESGFERILHYTGAQDYWEVTDKLGTVRVYGKGDGWTGRNPTNKYRWLLESVTDKYGNRIRYEYVLDAGEAYIESIRYTESEKTAGAGPYEVYFEYYNDREDIQENGRGKFIARTKKRLDRIEMRYKGQLIRSYRIEYESQRYFGYTQLIKFGEEEAGSGSEYQWSYGFEYEDLAHKWGEPVLFDQMKVWGLRGGIQEQYGENGGGSGMLSGGLGIGPSSDVDIRGVPSVHYAFTTGYTETERKLIDINGDGKPDIVWLADGVVKSHLNTGEGFEVKETPWVFTGGGRSGSIGSETYMSVTSGTSIFNGAGLPGICPGITTGETKQESWSNETAGFVDIDGDGLPDIAVSGQRVYWRNTGSSFEATAYKRTGVSDGIPDDEVLGETTAEEYDSIFYQQAPFRSWRTPVTGTVEVKHRVRPERSVPLTDDGVRALTYSGANAAAAAEYHIKEDGPREDGGTVTVADMARGQALYFVSDAGKDIRNGKAASSDIEWNITIGYKSLQYFQWLNRLSMEGVGGIGTGSLGSLLAAGNIPAVISKAGFERLQDLAEGLAEKERKERLEALYAFYRYDAGFGVCIENEDNAKRAGGQEWTKIKTRIRALFDLLAAGELSMFTTVRLPGLTESWEPLYDYEEGLWYYGESGNTIALPAGEAEGWYGSNGTNLHVDTYEGKELFLDTASLDAYLDGVKAGTGTIRENPDGTAVVNIRFAGHRQDYVYSGIKRWRSMLTGETLGWIKAGLESRSWLGETGSRWVRLNSSWYTALAGYANSMMGWNLSWTQGTETTYAYNNAAGEYVVNGLLTPVQKQELEACIGKFMAYTFAGCYEQVTGGEEAGKYRIRAGISGIALEVLTEESLKYRQYGWEGVRRSVRYFEEGIFAAEGNLMPLVLMANDVFVNKTIDISGDYSWDSGLDFSAQDLVSNPPFYETEMPEYEGEVNGNVTLLKEIQGATKNAELRLETVEMLSGGERQWYYGIWLGGNPFSEEKLYHYKIHGLTKQADPISGDPPAYGPIRSAMALGGNIDLEMEIEEETSKPIAGKEIFVGPVTVLPKEGWDGFAYYAPWIDRDSIHTNRAGGTAYSKLPVIQGEPDKVEALAMGYLNRSYSKGEDTVTTGGYGVVGLSSSTGTNTNNSYQQQGLMSISGSGYADMVQSRGGVFYVTPGVSGEDGPEFDAAYAMLAGGQINHHYSYVTTKGGTISMTGVYNALRGSNGVLVSQSLTGGGGDIPFDVGGETTSSSGSNTHMAGLLDINGDGLPDYISDVGVAVLNAGDNFEPSEWGVGNISFGESKSGGASISLGAGTGGGDGEQPGSGCQTGSFNISVSGSLNMINSQTQINSMLIDINGDGLPDRVVKNPVLNTITVGFNLGSSIMEEGQNFPLASWAGATYSAIQTDSPPADNLKKVPFFGSTVSGILNATPLGMMDLSGINALDYSLSTSWGVAGGMNIGGQITIVIPIIFICVNIPLATGGSVNWTSFRNQVIVRMMDIDGDGLPDHVLGVPSGTPGMNLLYYKRNLAGRVGLMRSILHPQGGRTEVDYELEYGTPDMPHAKYVMSSVTRYDGQDDLGITLNYDSEHVFETLFEYEGGYYDRAAKEHYGFNKVTTIAPDGTRHESWYNQGEYHLKGLPSRQEAYNQGWSLETAYAYREAPYAQHRRVDTKVREGVSSITGTVEYGYDSYGNVTNIRDRSDGAAELKAAIEWWNDDTRYFHAHPRRILVSSNDKPIRERTGRYHSDTGSLIEQTQKDGRGKDVTTVIGWDEWGNIREIKKADAWVRYVRDSSYHQYVETISRGGGAVLGPYNSRTEWDYRLGVKLKETDENGRVIRYEYDRYRRLTEVYSQHDAGIPAVRYEYHNPVDSFWYAVTENKVSFNPLDTGVLRTVIAVDGMGKAFITAKDGAKREGNTDIPGWNISGPVSIDFKGRVVGQGQNLFFGGTDVEDVLLYNYPRQNGEYGLKNPALTEYDSQDRPIKLTLADGTEETYTYAINGNRSIVTIVDPLLNRIRKESDSRGNIVEVTRFNRSNQILTSASYQYNAIGEMLKALDHENKELSMEYDLMGRRTAMQSGDMGRKEYYYDNNGNLERETDNVLLAMGKSIQYEYDLMHRLVKIKYPQSVATEYEYGVPSATAEGQANRIARLSDESGRTEYGYGVLGEVVRETRSIKRLNPARPWEETRTIEYTSNYLGQLEGILFQDGEEVIYEYNRGGQVQKVTGYKPSNIAGEQFEFPYVKDTGYDEFGQRVYLRYGNDVESRYRYDEKKRWLTRLETRNAGGSVKYQDIEYEFDEVGNVLEYSNQVQYYKTKQKYRYDNLYQLTEVTGESESYVGSQMSVYKGNYRQSYKFDGIGNMTLKESSSLQTGNSPLGDNLNYRLDYDYIGGTHKAGRIGQMYYAYDGNGNLISERFGSPVTVNSQNAQLREEGGIYSTDYGFALNNRGGQGSAGGVYERNFSWNERNLLRSSADGQYRVEYRYGADGQRAIKYAVSGGVQSESLYFNRMFQLKPVLTQEIESKHIYLGQTRIATKQKTSGNENYGEEYGKQYFYHGDHLGSAQMVTNSQGNIYEHLEYTPYGELWIDQSDASNPTPFRFTAKERDSETGFYYYGARYLDPKTSRWISTDPAMEEYIPGAPINDEVRKRNGNLPGMGGVFNVVNLHTYHYAGNNPVKLVDPDGRWQIRSYFNHDLGKTRYEMTTPDGNSQLARTVGSIFPLGSFIPKMQNALSNFSNKVTVTNSQIEFDSNASGFNGASLALDLIAFTPAGQASKGFDAINKGVSAYSAIGSRQAWAKDTDIQSFLNNVTFDLFAGIDDKDTAIAFGSALATGVNVYNEKGLANMNISENTWAKAVKNQLTGGNDRNLNKLYYDVMSDN